MIATKNYRQALSPAYYDALFGSDQFNFEDLNELISKSDPYVKGRGQRDVGNQSGIGTYKTFADLSNAAGHANALKTQFAKAKDKKAVTARLAALKKLGLSDREAVVSIDDPKYLDYFEMEGVPQRVKTMVVNTATKRPGGRTINEKQAYNRKSEKVDDALDFRERQQRRDQDVYLDRREEQLAQDLDYQRALQDEGLKPDYNRTGTGTRSTGTSGSGTRATTTTAIAKQKEEMDKKIASANKQRYLAGGLPVKSLSEIPDAIGSGVSKRIFSVNDSMTRNEDKLSRIDQEIAETTAEAEAAVANGQLIFDDKNKVFIAKKTKDGQPGDEALAKKYNDRFLQLSEQADELEFLLDDDDKSIKAITKEAEKLGLVVGADGEVYDPRTQRSYQNRHGDQFQEEDDYFAALPDAPTSEDEQFRRAQRSVMTPAQQRGVQQRIRELPDRPENDEETYLSRFNYFADELVSPTEDGRLVQGPNPNAHLSTRSQFDVHYNDINEVKAIRDKILSGEIEIPQELNSMGYDATQAAVELFKARKYARR